MTDDQKKANEWATQASVLAHNAEIFRREFPPELGWHSVQGALYKAQPDGPARRVKISGYDHKGEETSFWVDLPNAMFLMAMLYNMQKDLKCPVPLEPAPPPRKP